MGFRSSGVAYQREREIAQLVAAGKTNKEIGALLFLSDKTIRNYLSSAFAKLGITRRTEVAPLLQRRHP